MKCRLNPSVRGVSALVFVTLFVASALQAQPVADGATAVINNVTNSINGEVVIGTNGSFTTLILTNGALLTNSFNGRIGQNFGANSNTVWLTGSNTRWLMPHSGPGTLYVGDAGAFNRLVITNGALVRSVAGYVGGGVVAFDATNNSVTVSGPNSIWTNLAEVVVGNWSGGSRLEITNGGTVFSAQGVMGNVSPHNTVLISGPGSRWTNSLNIVFAVGSQGHSNSLIIENGGRLDSRGGSVGSSLSRGNLVVLAGTNSLWNNNLGPFYVQGGNASQPNQVIVSNGATMLATNTFVGVGTQATNNLVAITGAGTLWSNQWAMIVGHDAPSNRLQVLNGARLVSRFGVLGTNAISAGNSALVSGPGAIWTNETVSVGLTSSNNSLVVSNGGLLASIASFLGVTSNSANNQFLVTGTNSMMRQTDDLYIGYGGSGNRLLVENGAFVTNYAAYVGWLTGANSNEVRVSGSGSLWTVAVNLQIGNSSRGNRLIVTNGGVVLAGSSVTGLGQAATPSADNEVLVTGAGSIWSNRSAIAIGNQYASGDRLTILDGGAVFASGLSLGPFNSANNRITVDNGTLRLTNAQVTSALDLRGGTNVLNAGVIEVDRLPLTVPLGVFEFNGGTLITRTATISNGVDFVVGANGTVPAVWDVRYGPAVPMSIPNQGTASPYPSVVSVAALGGEITNLTVTLNNFSHTFVGDVDMLLVGPTGQNVMLMSDVGAGGVTNVTLTFSDAGVAMTNNVAITNGIYRPTDFNLGPDSLPAPAPSGPYGQSLSSFNGWSPNGVWSLYVFDQNSGNNGSLVGWSLQIKTTTGTITNLVNDGRVTSLAVPLVVGQNTPGSQLLLTNSNATLLAPGGVTVGLNPASTNNRIVLANAVIRVTNVTANAELNLRRGTNAVNSGFMEVDRLIITNSAGQSELNGGTLQVRAITNSNGRAFTVGNGTDTATLILAAVGATNRFSNGLAIADHAVLTGDSTIDGQVIVQPGGTLSPGQTFGSFRLNMTPVLQGITELDIVKFGPTILNDQIRVSAPVTYSGTLRVRTFGGVSPVNPFTVGDNFKFFNATSYSGSFSAMELPYVGDGLGWTNKLLIDGSMEIIAAPALPKFSSVALSGTNIIFSGTNGTLGTSYAVMTATNITLPASSWVSLRTNQFGPGGGFSFTNGIVPGEPQRYFRIRTP